MPFPTIRHCVVCEDVRQERNNKATILGFYGVAPDFNVKLRDFTRPLEKILFVLIADPAPRQTYAVKARLLTPQGNVLNETAAVNLELVGGPNRNSFIIGFTGLTLPGVGTYHFEFVVDDVTAFRTSFFAEQGQPQDFR